MIESSSKERSLRTKDSFFGGRQTEGNGIFFCFVFLLYVIIVISARWRFIFINGQLEDIY